MHHTGGMKIKCHSVGALSRTPKRCGFNPREEANPFLFHMEGSRGLSLSLSLSQKKINKT